VQGRLAEPATVREIDKSCIQRHQQRENHSV